MKKIRLQTVFSFVLSLLLLCETGSAALAANSYTPQVVSVRTDKALYAPGETADLTISLENSSGAVWNGSLNLEITHLEQEIDTFSFCISVPAGSTHEFHTAWTVPARDFTGYLITASIDSANYASTALDCSSDLTVYPRYGYVYDYPEDQTAEESDAMIRALAADFHINAYQLYDWMWRHETLIERNNGSIESTWQDLFNRTISWATIEDYISSIHRYGGSAMAYAMSYAAREGYEGFGIEPYAGLFLDRNHSSQLNVDFGNGKTFLWLFNPANPAWQQWMVSQYIDAINSAGFDGIQIDQMGQRSNLFDYDGNSVDLGSTFSSFINAAKGGLTANNAEKNLVTFNIVDGTVDGWALDDVIHHANTDFNYSEIWWLSDTYHDIKNYIEQVRSESDGKALVLAAYMNYEDNCGVVYEAEDAQLNNVSVNTNHPGYTGSGFVDEFYTVGDSVTFTIDAPEDGLYSFIFRYANSGSGATRKIYVDGEILDEISFGTMSSWDEWSHDACSSSYLAAGIHTVSLVYEDTCVGAINLDNLTLGTFDENSIRLANAAFAASGASHIEIGAGQGAITMLSHEYYPKNAKAVRNSLREAMKHHYDFITAYENLLYDSDITYSDTGVQYLNLGDEPVSGAGEVGKIWYIARQTTDYQIVHLINLTGENDTYWRNATSSPIFKTNIPAKYYVGPGASVTGVYLASPDFNGCRSQSLDFAVGTDENGTYVSFTIPQLKYWDMVYIRRTEQPNSGIYEAEDALKANVTTNTDHPGYTGQGFVDGFESSGDSVGFTVSILDNSTYTVKLRYANGSAANAIRGIAVDGKYVGKVQFPANGNWDRWEDAEIEVNLKPGIHTIVVYYGEDEYGAINLDNLQIMKK